MKPRTLHDLTSKVDRVFEIADSITDDEVKAHLAKYLCVISSGYLEESLRVVIGNYALDKSHRNIANYITAMEKNHTNLNTERICTYLNSFNSEWRERFTESVTPEEKDAIDSVVANRHQIAHGRNVGVSYIHIKNWFALIEKTIQEIEVIVNS